MFNAICGYLILSCPECMLSVGCVGRLVVSLHCTSIVSIFLTHKTPVGASMLLLECPVRTPVPGPVPLTYLRIILTHDVDDTGPVCTRRSDLTNEESPRCLVAETYNALKAYHTSLPTLVPYIQQDQQLGTRISMDPSPC